MSLFLINFLINSSGLFIFYSPFLIIFVIYYFYNPADMVQNAIASAARIKNTFQIVFHH